MRKSWVLLLAVALLAGCTSEATPSTSTPVTSTRVTLTPGGSAPALAVGASPSPGGCSDTPLWIGAAPEWTASAGLPGSTPYVLSHEGNLVAVLFGFPLRAGANVTGPTNKILWVAREPRDGKELQLTLRRADGAGEAVTQIEPADSGPGEIYPSIVDAPTAGCWQVQASWNGHTATLALNYT
jgi:hypothetical protein